MDLQKSQFPNSLVIWGKFVQPSLIFKKPQFPIFFLNQENLRSLLRATFKNPKIFL